MKLNSATIKSLEKKSKRYTITDGDGLAIEVHPSGVKTWRFRYSMKGKEHKLTIGTFPEISLKDARIKANEQRIKIANGINPTEKLKEEKAISEGKYLFEKIARDWIERFSIKWTSGHKQTVTRRLELNIFPDLGTYPISKITATILLEVLRKVEARGALETAQRTRSICSSVFRYAIASGLTERDPAADLVGALTPPPKRHFASITDPKRVGQLLRDMQDFRGSFPVYCALQLSPLLFVRPGELRQAEWTEIDFEQKEWRIPAHKMKMRTTHIVPLAEQAIKLLQDVYPITSKSKFVFPASHNNSRPMSENTINVAIRRLGYTREEMTAHGFRSMASTLLNELGWNSDAIERQLAHGERNKVRAAYNYAEFLPERRKMMQAWADYLDELRLNS